jgi:hypothetical protein
MSNVTSSSLNAVWVDDRLFIKPDAGGEIFDLKSILAAGIASKLTEHGIAVHQAEVDEAVAEFCSEFTEVGQRELAQSHKIGVLLQDTAGFEMKSGQATTLGAVALYLQRAVGDDPKWNTGLAGMALDGSMGANALVGEITTDIPVVN